VLFYSQSFAGLTIYEWEQTLEGVDIFIAPPEGVRAKMIDCKIAPNRLTVGLKGNPPFINEEFPEVVKVSESIWTLDDGVIHIALQKMSKGTTWNSALKGHQSLDLLSQEGVKKQLMLERFQEEHPGFDFSGAEFSGQAPDPKSFMGGIA